MKVILTHNLGFGQNKNNWAVAATRDIQQCGIFSSDNSDEPCSALLRLEASNDVQSVA